MKTVKTIRASKNVRPTRPVKASRAALRRRAVKADDEIIDETVEDIPAPAEADVVDEAEVSVDEDASELLFETEDVAELLSEATGLPVDVTMDEDQVVFEVGDDVLTVTPDGDEEVVEQSTRIYKSAKKVAASRRMTARRPVRRVAASRRVAARRAPARSVAASRKVVARRPQK